MKEKRLTSRFDRECARRTRDMQWRFMERIFEWGVLWFCCWNKRRLPEGPDEWRSCLMTGMDIFGWMQAHPDWFTQGEWDEERYAFPVSLTSAGKEAMFLREAAFDMEPLHGGLVEPGYVVRPLPSTRRAS